MMYINIDSYLNSDAILLLKCLQRLIYRKEQRVYCMILKFKNRETNLKC